MLTTLSSILTIPAQITSSMREALTCRSCRTLLSLLEQERELTKALLGFQDQAQTTSELPTRSNWPRPEPVEPLDELDALPPEIRNVLIREYQEHLSTVPHPTQIHPEVEQIVPGQTMILEQ